MSAQQRHRLSYRGKDGLGALQIRGAIPSPCYAPADGDIALEKARPIFTSQSWSGAIESKDLRDLAYSLIKLDQACIYSIQTMRTDELFRIRDQDEDATSEMDTTMDQTLAEFKTMMSGEHAPSIDYLRSSSLGIFWVEVRRRIRYFMNLPSTPANDPTINSTKRIISALDKSASSVAKTVIRTSESEQLDDNMLEALRVRWLNLDSIHDTFACNTHAKRKSEPWQELMGRISQTPSSSQTQSKIAIMMWSTFIVTNILTLPTVALGWQYSIHKAGTTKDSDFWFLLQSCGMALLSLFTMALPMWKGTNLPKASSTLLWIFMAAGAISAIAAPVFYLYLPTEWSSFLNIIAGAIQAFATLQIALAAEKLPGRHLKRE